jgi:hypothetical protein
MPIVIPSPYADLIEQEYAALEEMQRCYDFRERRRLAYKWWYARTRRLGLAPLPR